MIVWRTLFPIDSGFNNLTFVNYFWFYVYEDLKLGYQIKSIVEECNAKKTMSMSIELVVFYK